MTSYVFDETLLGKASALVATDVDVRPFAFEEKDGRFVDTLEFLLVVAHRESGRVLPLRPEGRDEAAGRRPASRLAADLVPDRARLRAGARRLPGQDRRARQEQRPHRHRRPRVRGAGPERVPGLDAGRQRHAPGPGRGQEGDAAAGGHRPAVVRARRHAVRAASRSTARPRRSRRGCRGSPPATSSGGTDGTRRSWPSTRRASTRPRWASCRASSARRSGTRARRLRAGAELQGRDRRARPSRCASRSPWSPRTPPAPADGRPPARARGTRRGRWPERRARPVAGGAGGREPRRRRRTGRRRAPSPGPGTSCRAAAAWTGPGSSP